MPVEVGRYLLHHAIASGGMATVHAGRVLGPAGFSRIVAIKRLHPELARDSSFAAMFLDEARLASRIQHPNVIGTIDVVAQDGELFLVMDYVRGASLSQLLAQASRGEAPPPSIGVVVAIAVGMLYGLHAAHEARDASGQALDIVHRDVSPQNILVGCDGLARVVDFGIAKAVSRSQNTREGELKGKLAYMAPEQLGRGTVDRRTDVYGAAVVLWEALTHERLFTADDTAGIVGLILAGDVPPPSSRRAEIPPALDAVVMRGLAKDREQRFATALDTADAILAVVPAAGPREVGAWVTEAGGESLRTRDLLIAELERGDPPRGGHGPGSSIEGMVLTGTARRQLVDAPTGRLEANEANEAKTDAMPSAITSVAASPSETSMSPRPALRIRAAVVVPILLASSAVAAAASFLAHRSPSSEGSAVNVPLRASASAAPIASEPLPSTPEPTVPVDEPAASVGASAPSSSSTRTTVPARSPDRSTAPSRAKRPKDPRHGAAAASSASPAESGSCNPPYTIDEAGIKRFKRWCPVP